MNKPLADAILGTFHLQSADKHFAALASFPLSAWVETYRWIDTSGLALYFIDRVKSLQREAALPASVLQRFEQNLADNRERTSDTFAEFVRISEAITSAGVAFVALKGISLVPHACPDPALRLQLDIDILIEMRQVQTCAVALDAMGYMLTGISGSVWEFKAGGSAMPGISDLYKAKPQRSLEVHFEPGRPPSDLSARHEWSTWEGFSFPVLGSVERFVGQATHILKHVRGEWTRLSWLLEFRHGVLHWKDDQAFWQQVCEQAIADRELQTALGVAIALATIAFGDFASEDLTGWTVDTLDQPMRMWIDHYGREAIMADYPGTKLYLLQPGPESMGNATYARTKRRRLLPLHKAPRVVQDAAGQNFASRMRGLRAQLIFILFRLRFHVAEGLRYMYEAPRWKKIVAAAQQPSTSLATADERGSL